MSANHRLICGGEACSCGSDTCACQLCGEIVCATQAEWMTPVPGMTFDGNVCEGCKALEDSAAPEAQRKTGK